MENLEAVKKLDHFLNLYSAANMVGKDFDCAPVRELCLDLKKENPEKFGVFITEGSDHELMVSVSDFLNKLLGI